MSNVFYLKSIDGDLPPTIELSEDPMNIIIDPQGIRTAAKGETMPRRKYFLASVHIEFMMFKGKQEVYEINLFCQDQTSLELIVVPDAIKNDTSTLDALGFTWNRNLNRYEIEISFSKLLPKF